MNYPALAIGTVMALAIACSARVLGFDRDRSFYPVILIVIASYYLLFAIQDGTTPVLIAELLFMSVFSGLALAGHRHSLWWVVAGLSLHGVFDVLHGHLVRNSGVPSWWPAFCGAYDLAAAAGLAWLLRRPSNRRLQTAP